MEYKAGLKTSFELSFKLNGCLWGSSYSYGDQPLRVVVRINQFFFFSKKVFNFNKRQNIKKDKIRSQEKKKQDCKKGKKGEMEKKVELSSAQNVLTIKCINLLL